MPELLALVAPTRARAGPEARWLPTGYRCPDEAVLDEFGPAVLPQVAAWVTLKAWWLKHSKGANTPNWDLALACELEGEPGLLLVEAKAHVTELKVEGKTPVQANSQNSADNDKQIRHAIAEAAEQLAVLGYATQISADRHYQLSNRLAFTWKLASLGVPTVLIYLGFLGDTGLGAGFRPFLSHGDWKTVLTEHAHGVGADSLFEAHFVVAGTPAWVLVRSRPVLEVSPRAS